MHNANSFEATDGDQFELAIAGHTHERQIRMPGFPEWSWASSVPQSPNEVKGD